MKAILILSSLAVAGTCLGQGTVYWAGWSPGVISGETNSTQYSPFFGGGSASFGSIGRTAAGGLNFCYELLYNTPFTGSQASVPNSLASLFVEWHDTGLTATNGPVSGGLRPVNLDVAAVVPWAAGVTNNIVLVGWSANLGTSWAAASNELANWSYGSGLTEQAFFGLSATGYLSPNTNSPGANVFGFGTTSPNGLPIFGWNMQLYLLPTPEPGTLVLGGLGGLALLLFRRWQRNP